MEGNIILIIYQLVVLLASVIVHEVSHGLMALRLGDDTAKRAGRLTMNPLRHLDPVGSIFLPLLLFLAQSPVVLGWAKPVPYNPDALYKDYKYGPLKVALAGPFSNLALALLFGLIVRFGGGVLSVEALGFLSFIVFLNCVLAVFNLIPVPPLDGSKILSAVLPYRYSMFFERIGFGGVIILMFLLFYASDVIWVPAITLFRIFAGVGGAEAFLKIFAG
jgi:Zn-dependent protease